MVAVGAAADEVDAEAASALTGFCGRFCLGAVEEGDSEDSAAVEIQAGAEAEEVTVASEDSEAAVTSEAAAQVIVGKSRSRSVKTKH